MFQRLLKVVLLAAVVAVAVQVLPDIARYLRMREM